MKSQLRQVLAIIALPGFREINMYNQGTLRRERCKALIQQMAEEESGAWGCIDTRDVIVRLTGQQTNHATSKLLVSSSSSMLTLDR